MVRHCIAFGCKNRSSKAECRDLSWHLLPLSNKNLLAQWLLKLRRENTPVNKNSYVCSQHFEANCFIKPMGGQRIRLKPDSIPTKFIFTVEKPKRKKPADRASLNTKKTEIEKLQEHSVSESINTEHTDLKSGSDGIETEHLESYHEGLVQTGDENWEHQLKLKDDEIACLLQTWQTKEHELNKKIQELENQLEEERRGAGRSWKEGRKLEGAGMINREESLQHRNCKG